jgi:SWI/SNF-related matrix-associated actin-dependent regulator of chromatin subfamily A member 5
MSPAKREAARAEKERLKQQAKAKKELLERMRKEETAQAASGDVRNRV